MSRVIASSIGGASLTADSSLVILYGFDAGTTLKVWGANRWKQRRRLMAPRGDVGAFSVFDERSLGGRGFGGLVCRGFHFRSFSGRVCFGVHLWRGLFHLRRGLFHLVEETRFDHAVLVTEFVVTT